MIIMYKNERKKNDGLRNYSINVHLSNKNNYIN
jgi:hypothetical protein